MAEQHPELVVTFMKGMIKVGRWASESQAQPGGWGRFTRFSGSVFPPESPQHRRRNR